jgi:hypothetical protein
MPAASTRSRSASCFSRCRTSSIRCASCVASIACLERVGELEIAQQEVSNGYRVAQTRQPPAAAPGGASDHGRHALSNDYRGDRVADRRWRVDRGCVGLAKASRVTSLHRVVIGHQLARISLPPSLSVTDDPRLRHAVTMAFVGVVGPTLRSPGRTVQLSTIRGATVKNLCKYRLERASPYG